MEETITKVERVPRLKDDYEGYSIVDRSDKGLMRDIVECAGIGSGKVCEPCVERLAELGRRQQWGIIASLGMRIEMM